MFCFKKIHKKVLGRALFEIGEESINQSSLLKTIRVWSHSTPELHQFVKCHPGHFAHGGCQRKRLIEVVATVVTIQLQGELVATVVTTQPVVAAVMGQPEA